MPSVVGGFTCEEMIEIMEIAGKNNKVALLDYSEFNPAVESQISSKLMVEMLYTFAMSFSSRK